MRLWSLHPRYFDRQALTACWREALLAQSVLAKPGRGYSNHPQLERFKDQADPVGAIGRYLEGLAREADARGYRFDREKIGASARSRVVIPVTSGQVDYEWNHLRAKLTTRSPQVARRWTEEATPGVHPMFTVVPGAICSWERVLDVAATEER